MRFLCKKCGAQSPGDISEVEIRDGALVFICKACGASATLVESRAKDGAGSAANGKLAEKGIVEPDENELVDLGEATLSRMLGKKVRIVAETGADSAEAENRPAPVIAAVEEPLPAFSTEPAGSPRGRRPRVYLAVAASVGLVAVATVALLEARPQRSPTGGVPASASSAAPGSVLPPAATELAPDAAQPEPVPAATPAAGPSGPVREEPVAEEKAARIEIKELAAPTPPDALPEPGGPGLPTEQVDAAFFRVRPGVRMCAVQEQRRHPDAKLGNEPVILTVAPSGAVTRVEFESHELAGTPLGACLTLELEKFRVGAFPGQPAVVRRVLELSRQGAPTS